MVSLRPLPDPVRVLVVDDQPSFHDVVRDLVEATAGFEWIGEARCGEEAVEQTALLRPDLILMDIRMPGVGGVEAARQISASGMRTIVVLVTGDEIPGRIVHGVAASEVVAKHRLSPALLRRLWSDHGRASPGTEDAGEAPSRDD